MQILWQLEKPGNYTHFLQQKTSVSDSEKAQFNTQKPITSTAFSILPSAPRIIVKFITQSQFPLYFMNLNILAWLQCVSFFIFFNFFFCFYTLCYRIYTFWWCLFSISWVYIFFARIPFISRKTHTHSVSPRSVSPERKAVFFCLHFLSFRLFPCVPFHRK